eukprot:tig00020553_g10661.t1
MALSQSHYLHRTKSMRLGDTAPSFEAFNADGSVFDFSAILGRDIVILHLVPGAAVDFYTKSLKNFQGLKPRFDELGAKRKIVSVIDQNKPRENADIVRRLGLTFPVIADPYNRVTAQYAPSVAGLSIMTYVIDRNGRIRYTYDSVGRPFDHSVRALEAIRSFIPDAPAPIFASSTDRAMAPSSDGPCKLM